MPVLLRKFLHELQLLALRMLLRILPSSPVPVMLAGTGSALQLCRAIADTGVRTVLVVTDRVLVQLGIVAPLVAELESRGVGCRVYDGIEPDPTHAQIEAGIAIVKEARSEAVLAIGGGSPMDAAKIIAACASNGTRVADIVGNFKVRLHPLPIYAIPTTAGTGAEVTVAAVVTDTAARAKTPVVDGKLVPAMAALDGSLMTGLPRGVTAASGMDALTHAVESFLSRFADERTRPLSIAAVRIVFRHLQRACDVGGDLEARQAMSLGASYAGLAFSRASVGYVHAIAHTLGGLYHTPHGLANAIVLPHVLDFYREVAAGALAELAAVIGADAGLGDRQAKADAFIARVRELSRAVGVPPVLDTLRAEDIPEIARRAMAEAQGFYPVPRFMSTAQCEDLLRRLLPG